VFLLKALANLKAFFIFRSVLDKLILLDRSSKKSRKLSRSKDSFLRLLPQK